MRRKLFFFLEKLQITRNERFVLGLLGLCLVILGSLNLVIGKKAQYDAVYYEELENVFGERSRKAEAERRKVMERYQPQSQRVRGLPRKGITELLPDSGDPSPAAERDTLININAAEFDELQEIPGIGPAYARRIIEWRLLNGSFTTVEQLLAIRGIGKKRLDSLRKHITL